MTTYRVTSEERARLARDAAAIRSGVGREEGGRVVQGCPYCRGGLTVGLVRRRDLETAEDPVYEQVIVKAILRSASHSSP